MPRFDALGPRVRRRLAPAFQELGDAEQEMAARLGLPAPPRLLLIDEETGVIVAPEERVEAD
ncbi:hypothetical protein [Massilia sp. GCM10023247]|uniref:hypothetical protein n=1 Tax=Massilia sp. GCM10023247 TaxID=3252643 RepID=UPI00361237C9